MELKYLNTFKTILETGSFQKAAKHLNYAQSTITLQVQLLEQELSVKLFEKIGRKMQLTQAGNELIPYIDSVIKTVEQMENYGKTKQGLTGNFSIAIPETLLAYQMPNIIKQFRNMAPNVKLSIHPANCFDIREQVLNGTVDLGIHYDIGDYGNTIIKKKLQQYSFVLIGSKEIDSKEVNFKIKNQSKNLCLLGDQNSYYYKIFNKYLQDKKILIENEIHLYSIETMKKLVKDNLGIAYLPRFTVEEELLHGSIQEIPIDIIHDSIDMVCTYHKNKCITPAMDLFLQLVMDETSFAQQER